MNAPFWLSVPVAALLLSACQASPPEPNRYDARSWKVIVPHECQRFFDGCNTCSRAPGAEVAACTKKACPSYQQPRCLDDQATPAVTKQQYRCDDNNRFTVYFGEYRADDMRVKLEDDELWLSDEQTRTAHRMTRSRSASGARFTDGELTYWSKAEEAMLLLNNEPLYRNCKVVH